MNTFERTPPETGSSVSTLAVVVGALASLFTVAHLLAVVIDDRAYRALLSYVIVGVPVLFWYTRTHPSDRVGAVVPHHRIALAAALWSLTAGGLLFTAVTRYTHEPPSRVPVTGGAWGVVAYLLATTVCAGVLEEVVFRGTLQRLLSHIWGPAPAVVVVSAVFGALHLVGGYRLGGFLSTTISGICYGVLAASTRSVWPAAAAHACHNALVLAASHSPDTAGYVLLAVAIYLAASSPACVKALSRARTRVRRPSTRLVDA